MLTILDFLKIILYGVCMPLLFVLIGIFMILVEEGLHRAFLFLGGSWLIKKYDSYMYGDAGLRHPPSRSEE